MNIDNIDMSIWIRLEGMQEIENGGKYNGKRLALLLLYRFLGLSKNKLHGAICCLSANEDS